MRSNTTSDFEWRASLGSLRWLILGTLGLGHACGGRAATVLEGCIGETVAALEVSEALAHCEDVEACPVLERIAHEEGWLAST